MWRSEKSLLSLIEYRASHSPKNWTAQTPDFGNPANNPNSSFSLIINEKTWILAVIEGSGANYGTHLNVGHFMSHRMKEEMKGHTDINIMNQNNDIYNSCINFCKSFGGDWIHWNPKSTMAWFSTDDYLKVLELFLLNLVLIGF